MDHPLKLNEIRDKAVEMIKENPTGIRQIDLIKKLLDVFRDRLSGLLIPEHRIRNAVWNLETKSDEVIKQSVGERNVIFLPKKKKMYFSDHVDYIVHDEQVEYSTSSLAKGKMISVWYLITALEEALADNSSSVDRVFNFSPEELGALQQSSIDTIFEMRQAINAIRRARAAAIGDEFVF